RVVDVVLCVISLRTTPGPTLFPYTTLFRSIQGARDRGVRVTTEAYPYTASQTRIESAIFRDGWQERAEIGYGGLQWVATGERLTDRKSTRLNSSHVEISYAVFCSKKKNDRL